jgi:hypothetical protein
VNAFARDGPQTTRACCDVVPVLASAPVGTSGTVTVQASDSWREVSGEQVIVSFQSAGLMIGDGMSIQNVVPGGSFLPSGSVVAINGQGFTAKTRLQLGGVAWANLQFVNSSLLTFTLTGSADLTGRLLQLEDANGTKTRYNSNLTPTSLQNDAGISGYSPIFPVATYTSVYSDRYVWLENPALDPIDVTLSALLDVCTPCRGNTLPPTQTIGTREEGEIVLLRHGLSWYFEPPTPWAEVQ